MTDLVTLDACPPGLFMFGDTLGFKSEYRSLAGDRESIEGAGWKSDAYCVESGEYFWGGMSNWRRREALMVQPVDYDQLLGDARATVINSPETADFMAGVPLEAAHQRARWGTDHDAGKTPFDWFWLIGYLAQKAASAAVSADFEKARHHTISTAAALANWHATLSGFDTTMRLGIDPEVALA